MVSVRLASVAAIIALAASGSSGAAASLSVPLPSTGNVSVTRITLERVAGPAGSAPRLSAVSARAVPPTTFVLSSASRRGLTARYDVTVAAIDSGVPVAGAKPQPAAKAFALRLPAGFRIVTPARSAGNALYQNTVPAFRLVSGGSVQVLAGRAPGKLPPARIVRDAQLLALDRSVPLADMQLIGLQWVALQVPAKPALKFTAAVGMSRLNQVNAVELRFPAGVRVVRAAGPDGTSTIPVGQAVQFVASSGFFQEGLQYPFTVELDHALKAGQAILVRASEHYFEGVLPFQERFFPA